MGPVGADGYHPVRSLMVALEGCEDVVEVRRAAERTVRCPGIDGPDNLAWRALDALEAEVGRALPVHVAIDKRIPSQAGLGGGSSDAAAVLVAADALHGLALGPEGLEAVAGRVGADVAFFVRGGTQWAEGRGERLSPTAAPPFAALLAKPDVGLSTPAVYRAFDRGPAPPPAGGEEPPGDIAGLARWVRNDLWPPALALRPGLGRTARALSAAGARAVLLCGSGSCMAGLFADRDAASAAAGRIVHEGFLTVVTPASRPRGALPA